MAPLYALFLVPTLSSSPEPAPSEPLAPLLALEPAPVDPVGPQTTWPPPPRARWSPGQSVLQGFIGVNSLENLEVDGGTGGRVEDDDVQAPVIGGGAQWKLGGERIDFGLEAMMAFSWRSDATAIAVGGSGAAVAVDIDSLVFELYGGPMANVFLGEKARIYVSAGGLIEWVEYDQVNLDQDIYDSGSGFGTGWYARTGIEFAVSPRSMVGLGLRWADSTVDLDGGLGDLEMEGFQAVLTVTNGF